MCAAYTLRPTKEQMLESFKIEFFEDFVFDRKIVPQAESMVVVNHERFEIKSMVFGLTPSWSKEAKVKFATHNARLESILEKPTWRGPLKAHRCLVPITEFIEPIYTGEYAGNMVKFSNVGPGLLVAAGIFDIWINKETGEVKESFSIVTADPPDFVAKIGHDRCPLFLKTTAFDKWLDCEKYPPKQAVEILKSDREDFHFQVGIERPLAKGWERRLKSSDTSSKD
jgi:putative SOS response-associated peptidase YedK